MKKIYGYIIDGKVIENPSKEELEKYDKDKLVAIYKGHISCIVFENWWVDENHELDFCYTIVNDNGVPVSVKRNDFFKLHGIEKRKLRSYILPPECFTDKGVELPND